MVRGAIVGISATVFAAVAAALLWASTTWLYNRLRPHSLPSALLAGAAVAVVGMVVLTTVINLTSSGDSSTGASADGGPRQPAPDPEVELDEDEDGLPDAVDECPYEVGDEPSGCPDVDGDGILDKLDRCPEEAATTSDGCPARPRVTSLTAYIEAGSHETLYTENTGREQITVAGITDPMGVRMEVGAAYRSAAFTIPTNRAVQTIRGRVGISSEPCSAGSVAYVGIRNAEGQQLWPQNGRLKTIHREAVPFEVQIASEDAVVLYAEAPEAEEGYCGSYYGTTEVGWVHAELLSEYSNSP